MMIFWAAMLGVAFGVCVGWLLRGLSDRIEERGWLWTWRRS